MSAIIEKICAEVSKRVTPSNNERRRILELAHNMKRKVTEAAEAEGVKVTVRVEGSVAKDTWLSEEPDIDIFMRVPPIVPREEFGKTLLKIARKATKGLIQIERFAEHAYLEAVTDNIRVNIVPCYQVEQGEWISATDRTPFHTDYVKARLKEKSCIEIRILKKFMKKVGVYGAEIKVGGFSGYLCELLVLNYGSFAEVLESFAGWKGRHIIDYEGLYGGTEENIGEVFEEPLVVVDPVDKRRNAAAAVRVDRLNEFVAAAREFLNRPHLGFFYPTEMTALSDKKLLRNIEIRGSTLVFVNFRKVETVPDVLWGQLYKSQRSIREMLEKHGFNVIRDVVWSDEENLNAFIFELEEKFLPLMKKHLGPPIRKRTECERFLQKHLDAPHTVSGPRVEGERWVVEIKRKHRDVVDLLNSKLRGGGRNIGVAGLISHVLSEGFEILVNEEILETYASNLRFAKFLMEYLKGKPGWLQ
ncbi:MAG: CCA tRNA nucleotidyltransferase [Candidatus Bathyarchaeota archaeon]|nr:MAG: CCA tRNA nucleotidyltransferase [Candidatus Bathyarchaeota archaeon]